MPHHVRLQVKGYFGDTSSDPVHVNGMAADIWNSAVTRGDVGGLKRYINEKESEHETGSESNPPPIGLDYTLTSDPSQNAVAAWTCTQGTNWLILDNEGFPDSGVGLLHQDSTANTVVQYRSTWAIDPNRPWTIHLFRYEMPKTQNVDLIVFDWDNWRLEIRKGQAKIQCYNSIDPVTNKPLLRSTRVASQAALDALLAGTPPLSAANQTQVAVYRHQLYLVDQSISLGANSDQGYDAGLLLTFIPEGRGRLAIETEGAGRTIVEHKGIAATGKAGTMWGSSALTITSQGGGFSFQTGNPAFNKTGYAYLGQFYCDKDLTLFANLATIRFNRDTTNPGTAITNISPVDGTALKTIQGTSHSTSYAGLFQAQVFLSGDGRYTPWLYDYQLSVAAGSRTGDDTVIWDTDSISDSAGNPPITKADPTYEADLRRSSWKLSMRVVRRADGSIELANSGSTVPSMINRMVDLQINGSYVARGYIVQDETWSDMAAIDKPGLASPDETAIGRRFPHYQSTLSTLNLTLVDPWYLADQDVMTDDPVLDGLHLSDALRTVKLNQGWKTAELAGIPTGVGYRIPAAALGKPPSERPSTGCNRGDYERSLITRYGFNYSMWWDNVRGTWTFAVPSTTSKFTFSSLTATPTGAYQVQNPIDLVTDPGDFFNHFTVTGDINPLTKQAFIYVFKCEESTSLEAHPMYIGRVKRHKPVHDKSLRTQSDVYWACLSLFNKKCRPFQFAEFNAVFVPGLYPGDRITLDGLRYEVTRIPSASVFARLYKDFPATGGTMKIVARRLDYQNGRFMWVDPPQGITRYFK